MKSEQELFRMLVDGLNRTKLNSVRVGDSSISAYGLKCRVLHINEDDAKFIKYTLERVLLSSLSNKEFEKLVSVLQNNLHKVACTYLKESTLECDYSPRILPLSESKVYTTAFLKAIRPSVMLGESPYRDNLSGVILRNGRAYITDGHCAISVKSDHNTVDFDDKHASRTDIAKSIERIACDVSTDGYPLFIDPRAVESLIKTTTFRFADRYTCVRIYIENDSVYASLQVYKSGEILSIAKIGECAPRNDTDNFKSVFGYDKMKYFVNSAKKFGAKCVKMYLNKRDMEASLFHFDTYGSTYSVLMPMRFQNG